jgi:membrane protein DedA with SNARE-associated domain
LIALGTARRALGLAALYAFGWAYGQTAVAFVARRYGRAGRALRWAERSLARFGIPLVLVAPMPTIALMAGVAGTRFAPTAVAFTAGQLFWVSLTWAFGDQLSAFTTPILDFLSAHLVEATAISAVAVLLWQLRAWRRGRDG